MGDTHADYYRRIWLFPRLGYSGFLTLEYVHTENLEILNFILCVTMNVIIQNILYTIERI